MWIKSMSNPSKTNNRQFILSTPLKSVCMRSLYLRLLIPAVESLRLSDKQEQQQQKTLFIALHEIYTNINRFKPPSEHHFYKSKNNKHSLACQVLCVYCNIIYRGCKSTDFRMLYCRNDLLNLTDDELRILIFGKAFGRLTLWHFY